MDGKRIQMVFATPGPNRGGRALSAYSESKSSVVSSLLSSMVCFTTVEKKWKFASGNTAHCFNVLMLMESYMQIDVSAELQSVILVQATSRWESLSREGSSLTLLPSLKISCQNKFSNRPPLLIPALVKRIAEGIILLTTGSLCCMQEVFMNSKWRLPLLYPLPLERYSRQTTVLFLVFRTTLFVCNSIPLGMQDEPFCVCVCVRESAHTHTHLPEMSTLKTPLKFAGHD